MRHNTLIFLLVATGLAFSGCAASHIATTNANTAPPAHDHANMEHSDHGSMQSSPDAEKAPYDLQFIDTMVMHHQGAVVMSQPAESKAQHAELRTLAKNIIADQEKEIAQMKKWREEWFAGKPAAINMEMAGMSGSMKGMDMKKLGSLSGNDHDVEFVKQMIPHHQGAVIMAREALQRSSKPEIKTLAESIIRSQEAEIRQMKDWLIAWSK